MHQFTVLRINTLDINENLQVKLQLMNLMIFNKEKNTKKKPV